MDATETTGNANFTSPGLSSNIRVAFKPRLHTLQTNHYFTLKILCCVQDKIQTSENDIQTPHGSQPLPWQFLLPPCAPGSLRSGPVPVPLSLDGFLTHPCLTGDTREAFPAILPMIHHCLRYLFRGNPWGPVFISLVGFITFFWFNFHVSVSSSLTVNSWKDVEVSGPHC